MYIPSSFAERDLDTLFAYMQEHPLAAVVTGGPADGLLATHLPLVLDRTSGPLGTLGGHFARANPHARCVADGAAEALVIFSGPDAYITPQWYQTTRDTGRAVPTWNYIAVHAWGTLRRRDDAEFLRAHLEALTHQHEAGRPSPWRMSDAPADFIDQQIRGIIGVELRIDRLEGKWKMSQNRTSEDIDGVVRGLGESTSAQDRAVGAIVAERRPSRS